MKKVGLVLICTVIILFFVGFNYLLWDRENKAQDIESLEYTNENNADYINFLAGEKKRIEDESKALKQEIDNLNEKIGLLNRQMDNLEEENDKTRLLLQDSKKSLEVLMKQVDREILKEVINTYVTLLDGREYEQAYGKRYGHELVYGAPPDLSAYIDRYRGKVESIRIDSVEYIEALQEDNRGRHMFNVMLEVKLMEGADEKGCEFMPGMNSRIFVMGFDESKSEWVIADIQPPGS